MRPAGDTRMLVVVLAARVATPVEVVIGKHFVAADQAEVEITSEKEALEALKEKLQDYQALTELYGHRGNVLLMQNKLELAEKTMKKALKLNEGNKNKLGLVVDYRNLGNLCLQRTEWAMAERYYTLACNLNEEMGFKPEVAEDYRNLFNLYVQKGDWKLAEKNGCKSYHRVPALGTNKEFINSLCKLVTNINGQNGYFPPQNKCPNNFKKCPCSATT